MVRAAKMALLTVLAVLATVVNVSVTFAQDVTTELYDVQGRVVGSASVTDMGDGMTEVVVNVSGMNPVAGDRRLAITERGYCSDDGDYSSAGDDAQVLPAVQFYTNGGADYKMVVDDVNTAALADANGSALVIYADSGDEPGDRIICGLLHEDPGLSDSDDSGDEAPAPPADDSGDTPADDSGDDTPAEETPAPPADDSGDDAPADDSEYDLEAALNAGSGAILRDVQGRVVGFSLMFALPEGTTGVTFYLEGMEAGSADHRVAITDAGECEAPDFASAGDEVMNLPNVQFYSSGTADYGQEIEDLNLESLRDDDGSAFVIYADAGEDPGDRIICGTITSTAETLGYFGFTVEDFVLLVAILAGA